MTYTQFAGRILLVEDNPADVLLLTTALAELHVDAMLSHCEDGEAAIDFVSSRRYPPDLIVLDLNIPRRDGFEVFRAVRESPAWAEVPVIVLTCSPSPSDRTAAEALGASCFSKPQTYAGYIEVAKEIGSRLASNIVAVA